MSLHNTISTKPVQWLKAMALLVLLVLAHASALAQSTVTFFHNDIAGTPLAATDSAGNLVWKETYRPYGERLTHSPASSTNSVWFTSKPQDTHTGLVYMGARYYDPVIGRFMGTDPVGFVQGNVHSVNRYAYANNNPYRFVDPDGKHPLVVFAAVGLFMLDFHHAATSNEPFTGIGSSVAQGGRLAGNLFARSATSEVGFAAKGLEIAPGKFDYLFGRVSSNAHNAARSNQLALEMKRLGVPDTAAGRQMLTEHLAQSASAEGNVVRSFSNQYGSFEVRESLFMGPSGKATNLQSTFQVLEDGTRRLSTVIPLH